MAKKSVMLIRPQLETTAVWNPQRASASLGLLYTAAELAGRGHEVIYHDEVVRDGGLSNTVLLRREVRSGETTETPLRQTLAEFQKEKMAYYKSHSPREFVDRYSAFNEDGAVVRDIVRTGVPMEDTLRDIGDRRPDVVGISLVPSADYLPATRLGREIKLRFPEIRVIFGGQHVSALPSEFLRDNPYVDNLVLGDSIELINDVVEGRVSDRIVNGGFVEMGRFPFLDPKIMGESEYPIEPLYAYTTQGRRSIDFMFTKGCYRPCTFCAAGSRSKEERHVSAAAYEKLDRQLALFRERGIEELVIQDDAFLHDSKHRKGHLEMLLDLMKRYGFYWQNNAGVEFEGMTDEVTDRLIRYNEEGDGRLTALYVPFNPRLWNADRSASRSMSSKYPRNVENLRRLREEGGVYVFTSAILGSPDNEQTEQAFWEELETDRELITKGYIDTALCLSATMLPGTGWYWKYRDNIIDTKDWAGYSLFATHHRTKHLGAKDIEWLMVTWTRELDDVQKTYPWGTAFPNSAHGPGGTSTPVR